MSVVFRRTRHEHAELTGPRSRELTTRLSKVQLHRTRLSLAASYLTLNVRTVVVMTTADHATRQPTGVLEMS